MSAIEPARACLRSDFRRQAGRDARPCCYAPAAEFAPITQASSLGAEDVVITHLINSLELDIPIFVLETGMLHQQTLDLLERTQATSRAPVNVYRPVNEAVIQFVAREGNERHVHAASSCARPAATSARSSRWSARWPASVPGSPACAASSRMPAPKCRWWTPSDEATTAASSSIRWPTGPGATSGTTSAVNKVDYNPLHDEFYPSIGCAPCTRAISLGEDFRAGRWWWEDEAAKECGLHVKNDETKEEASA